MAFARIIHELIAINIIVNLSAVTNYYKNVALKCGGYGNEVKVGIYLNSENSISGIGVSLWRDKNLNLENSISGIGVSLWRDNEAHWLHQPIWLPKM